MNKLKIITLFSILGASTSVNAEDFDLVNNISDFYKIYNIDVYNKNYIKAKNHIKNLEETKKDLEIRTIIDYIDYCGEQETDYRIACFSILSKAGHHDALKGIAEEFYDISKKNLGINNNAQMKYLIFSAKKFGIAEGLKNLNLTENSPYRSFRLTFEDLKESESLEIFSDLKFLDDFYYFGVIESTNYNLSNLYGQKKELLFEDLNFEIDIDNETKQLIENGDFSEILNELRELITDEDGISYLIKNASNENYEDIFVSLLRGENGFPEEHNISIYTLFDQGVNKNNNQALYYLIQESYRRHTLERGNESYNNEYLNNTIILSAILKNKAPYFNNNILDLLISNDNNYLKFIQNFNRIRKDYLK